MKNNKDNSQKEERGLKCLPFNKTTSKVQLPHDKTKQTNRTTPGNIMALAITGLLPGTTKKLQLGQEDNNNKTGRME